MNKLAVNHRSESVDSQNIEVGSLASTIDKFDQIDDLSKLQFLAKLQNSMMYGYPGVKDANGVSEIFSKFESELWARLVNADYYQEYDGNRLVLDYAQHIQAQWMTLDSDAQHVNSFAMVSGRFSYDLERDKEFMFVPTWELAATGNGFDSIFERPNFISYMGELSQDDRTSFEALLANRYFQEYISSRCHVHLGSLDEETFVRLVGYLFNADKSHFDRFMQVTFSKNDSSQFCSAFLTLEFGGEYGDVLLDVVEKLPNKDFETLMSEIDNIRTSSKIIRQFYSEHVDTELGFALEKAINKRISEVLVLVKRIAIGESLSVHNRETDQIEYVTISLEEALNRLAIVSESLQNIASSLTYNFSITQVVHSDKDYRGQLRADNDRVRSTLRPRATQAGEARIAYETHDKNNRKITVRLDLDTRFIEKGQLSLDIGSTSRGGDDKQIAYFLSLAEAAFAQEQGKDIRNLNGYHVREAFDSIQITPEIFEQWVNRYLYALQIND